MRIPRKIKKKLKNLKKDWGWGTVTQYTEMSEKIDRLYKEMGAKTYMPK